MLYKWANQNQAKPANPSPCFLTQYLALSVPGAVFVDHAGCRDIICSSGLVAGFCSSAVVSKPESRDADVLWLIGLSMSTVTMWCAARVWSRYSGVHAGTRPMARSAGYPSQPGLVRMSQGPSCIAIGKHWRDHPWAGGVQFVVVQSYDWKVAPLGVCRLV